MTDKRRRELEKKIADSNHMSKPDAENVVVLYDRTGRWILEICTAGHTLKANEKSKQNFM